MAALQLQLSSSPLIPPAALPPHHPQTPQFISSSFANGNTKGSRNRYSLKVRAAKLPAGVELPKVEPKFKPPFLGFTRNAETWNSRACMIGLVGIFFVEFILHKGILQVIGIEVGKGLDLPL